MTGKMKHGERVKRRILDAGIALWHENPRSVTARAIATALNMTHPAVTYHFGSADSLRDAVAAHAVAVGDSRIIVQLIAQEHAAVMNMPHALRVSHMRSIKKLVMQ